MNLYVLIFLQTWEKAQQFVYRTSLKFRHLARDIRMTSDNDGFTVEKIEKRIKRKLGEMLQLSSETIDLNQPMIHYGVDSMMSVELTAWASKELGLGVTQLEVLNGMTAASLVKKATLGLH